MNFRRNYFAIALSVLGIAALTVRADDFWVKKPWNKWTKDECSKILGDSPWAKRWAKGEVNLTTAMPGVSGAASEGAGGEKSTEVHYVVQLRSSIPVRQATVRMQQIQMKYEQMPEAQKKEFDTKAGEFVNRTYDDVILVHVDYGSNVQAFEREMAVYFKTIREGSVPIDFYLINDRGDREAPVRFVSPQNGSYSFDMTFPRMKDNEPFIRPGDKAISIQFLNPALGNQGSSTPAGSLDSSIGSFGTERVLIQYKLDKMNIGGKTSY